MFLMIFKNLIFILFITLSLTNNAQSIQKENRCSKPKVELWREYSQSGRHQEAIKELLKELKNDNQSNKHAIYWHIGQEYAFNNDYKNAILNIRKSTRLIDRIFDREWRWYYKGTISFLNRDKVKLKKYHSKSWEKHSSYYYNNACMLKVLFENFDKSYKEASKNKCK